VLTQSHSFRDKLGNDSCDVMSDTVMLHASFIFIKVSQLQFYVTAFALTSGFPEFPGFLGMTFSHSRFPGIKTPFRK